MALQRKVKPGHLAGKSYSSASAENATLTSDDIGKLIEGDQADSVQISDTEKRFRISHVPLERRLEIQRDVCAAIMRGSNAPAELFNADWYAAQIHSRLEKCLRGADEAMRIALLLAFEAGALAKEAGLDHLERATASGVKHLKTLDAHREAAGEAQAEKTGRWQRYARERARAKIVPHKRYSANQAYPAVWSDLKNWLPGEYERLGLVYREDEDLPEPDTVRKAISPKKVGKSA